VDHVRRRAESRISDGWTRIDLDHVRPVRAPATGR
jgi:hypothetical protein